MVLCLSCALTAELGPSPKDYGGVSPVEGKVILHFCDKATPLQARGATRRLRLPEFLDSRHIKVVRLPPLRTGRLYPQEISPIDPQGHPS